VNSASCEDELKHIDQWATDNNLRLNQAKTVEIMFYARGRHSAEEELPPSLPGIQRVSSINVLGVTVSNNLLMAGHVSALLDTCARTLYGLRVLRAHGLRYGNWPSCFTQVLHGQASVLHQKTANLIGFSTDVENCIAVSS